MKSTQFILISYHYYYYYYYIKEINTKPGEYWDTRELFVLQATDKWDNKGRFPNKSFYVFHLLWIINLKFREEMYDLSKHHSSKGKWEIKGWFLFHLYHIEKLGEAICKVKYILLHFGKTVLLGLWK